MESEGEVAEDPVLEVDEKKPEDEASQGLCVLVLFIASLFM